METHTGLQDGFPSISGYNNLENDPLLGEMYQFSEQFIFQNLKGLDYYIKSWVANPIHNWSRRWEYIYVYQKLQSYLNQTRIQPVRLLDAGSGLTFFPHFVASRFPSVEIECCDNNPKLIEDAAYFVPPASPSIRYSLQDIKTLSYENESFDVIYCISVLEHCGYPLEIIRHFHRLLVPGGALILTIDISLDGKAEIPLPLADSLIRIVSEVGFKANWDYRQLIRGFQPQNHLSTNYILQSKQTDLLPWKPPRFQSLSCFCMSFVKPSIESLEGADRTP